MKKKSIPVVRDKKSFIIALLVCLAICVIGVIAYVGYIGRLNTYAINSLYVSLGETAKQQKFNIDQEQQSDILVFTEIAKYIGSSSESLIKNKELIEDLSAKTHFKELTLYDANRMLLASVGETIPLPEPTNDTIRSADDAMVDYTITPTMANSFLISVPIFDKSGLPSGTLVASHSTEQLTDVLLPFFHGDGITYIVSRNGDVIATCGLSILDDNPKGRGPVNFWNEISDTVYVGYDTFEQMEENLKEDISGNMIYTFDGQKRYAHYESIGIDDWFVFTVVDDSALSQHSALALNSAFVLTAIMIVTFSLLVFFILWLQHRHRNKLERTAYYDELCGCPNLIKFKATSQQFIEQHRNEKLVMIKLDIDRFKLVNQTFGTKTGDMILVKVAQALATNAHHDELRFGRAHDDEFYILQSYTTRPELKELRQAFFKEFSALLGKDFNYSIKFISGICFLNAGGYTSSAEAIERANIAHQKAKATGKEMCVYDETLITEALRKKDIEEHMEQALENHEFHLYLQPQYSLSQNKVFGAEALVRWCISETEKIYPNEFIPLFEENNFILKLDMYMFESVCQTIRDWIDSDIVPLTVSVNFARNHLVDINFVSNLCEIADRYDVPHNLLEVELTERVIAQDEDLSLKILADLHHHGFGLAMDDFGTGYSSLGLLKNTPVDVIKIDKSFFDNADDQPRTKAVLHNVLQLAKDLHAYSIAEGVETEVVASLLRELGCDAIQGYYYGHPIPVDDFKKSLMKKDKNE